MRGRDVALATMAAIAGFLVVGVAVTEATSASIEFSLLLGLPAGVLAGVIAFGAVYRGRGSSRPRWRRLSLAVATFGTAFLLLLVLMAAGLHVRNTVALLVAVVGGGVAAAAVYVRGLA